VLVVLIQNWDQLLDALEDVPDMREWVLQRYVDNPLLINGHKFHLRVYVLCVGALKVYVFNEILALLAAHRYPFCGHRYCCSRSVHRYSKDDMDDIYKHLTNTARSAEDINFEEAKFVKLLDDLPLHLLQSYPDRVDNDINAAISVVSNIRSQIHGITSQLFHAFENEYTIFSPMSNCFELFGLDFLVDESFNVSLLEVNPGPDFKQTGAKLKTVIEALFEDTLRTVVDPSVKPHVKALVPPTHMSLVYDVEWSVSRMQGGMQFSTK
jgi:tubulin--tyrosine ligase